MNKIQITISSNLVALSLHKFQFHALGASIRRRNSLEVSSP